MTPQRKPVLLLHALATASRAYSFNPVPSGTKVPEHRSRPAGTAAARRLYRCTAGSHATSRPGRTVPASTTLLVCMTINICNQRLASIPCLAGRIFAWAFEDESCAIAFFSSRSASSAWLPVSWSVTGQRAGLIPALGRARLVPAQQVVLLCALGLLDSATRQRMQRHIQ